MKRGLQAAALLTLCMAAAHAQLYKWTGPDGKVSYGDTPPPAAAERIETKPSVPGAPEMAGLPYELAQAVRKHPVTLYTTQECAACDEGRSLLSTRGIPFTEKTVHTREDAAQLRQAGGDGKLPVLTIGRATERGFESGAWNSALTAAGYPETSRLPKTYRNPPPVAAAPPPKSATPQQPAVEKQHAAPQPTATDLPPPAGNAPPGFRF